MDEPGGIPEMETLSQRIDELAREKRKFQDLVEGSMQGILIHRNFRILFANQALADIFGYASAAEMEAMGDVTQLIAPEELPRLKQLHEARLRGETPPSQYEFRGVRKAGRQIWVGHVSRRVDWEGTPAIQTTLVDISERRQVEEELRANRRLLQTVLDTIPHWVFVKDRESRFLMVNSAFANSHHADPADFEGVNPGEMPTFPEAVAQVFLETDQRVLDDGERVELPAYEVVLPDGGRQVRHAVKLPLRDEQGGIVGLVGLSEDMTEQKQAELELKKSKAVLDIILENIPSALSVVDRDLNMIVYNRLFTDLLEFPEALARNWSSFEDFTRYNAKRGEYGPGDVEAQVRERVELARKFVPHRFERKRPDGKQLEIRGNPLPDGGFCTIYTDISERKEAEEALRRSEQRFKDFAESTSDWFWEMDETLEFTYISDRFFTAIGATPEALLGKLRWSERRILIDDALWQAHLESLERRRPFRNLEFQVRGREGRLLTFRTSGKPVLDDEGVFRGYRGTGTDITSEVEAEQRAQEAHTRLTDAINSISEGFVLCDAEDRLVLCNEPFKDLYPTARELARPGLPFETLVRETVARGQVPEAVAAEEAWLAERMQQHRHPGPAQERTVPGGRSFIVREHKTMEGGTVGVWWDITERKEAEQALREREDLLWKHNQALLNLVKRVNVTRTNLRETLSDIIEVAARTLEVERCGIWLFEQGGATIRCMDLFELSSGVHSDGAVLDAASFPAYFAALREERSIAANDAHTDPRTRDFSTSYLTPLGISSMMDAPVWVGGEMLGILCHEQVGPRREWSLEEQAFAGSMADVVAMAMESFERRRAEDALITSERSLALAQQIAHLGSWIWDPDSELAHWSDELYRIIGCEPQAFEGSYEAILKFIHPEDREYFAAALKSVLRGESPYDFEHRVVRPDGTERHVHELAEVYRNGGGKPRQVVGTIHDITERKTAERALRESEQRLRTLMLNIPVILFSLDPEGIVLSSAGRGLALIRMTPGDMVGHSAFDLVGRRFKKLEEDVRRALKGEEVTSERRIGKTVFEFRYSPQRNAGGVLVNVTGLAIDITERKRIEEELAKERRNLEGTVVQRTQELKTSLTSLEDSNLQLQEANLAKARFLSSMSHELRTPLNGILGFAELLRGQHFGALNEKQIDYVNQVDSSGRHLLSLINDLLDMAKIDAGGMEIEQEPIDVPEFLEGITGMMSSQFNQKGIALEVHCPETLPILRADGRKCRQILLNLLSNAVKFTPQGGRVEITAETVPPGRLRVAVRDTGIGIESDEMEHIFSKYHQGSRVRAEQLGGVGIGLALTKRLVELHGGTIGVESTSGAGSTFWFELPLREEAGRPPPPKGAAAPRAVARPQAHRILVAEDNAVNLAVILDMLSIHGHETAVAKDGRQAIELAKSFRPELILMDVRMPVMDGLTATRELRALPAFADIPIIALTASTGSEAETRQLEAGFTEHLPKPIQTSELFAVIGRYLN